MKIDIRVLIISLTFHFFVYGLMSLVSEPLQLFPEEAIEVVIKDEPRDDKIQGYIPKLDFTKNEESNKKATVMSDEAARFQKETVSQNKGIAQNNRTSQGVQSKSQEKKLEFDKNSFMPLEKNPAVNRTSSIHLNLPHIENGAFTFLNADFSTYASFFNRIGPNIIGQWGQNIREFAYFPQVREQIVLKDHWITRIEVILDRKGYLKDVIVVNSAGLKELDNAVIDAIKSSAPFLNPPTGMIEADGLVHIHGQFSVLTRNPRLAN